MKNHVEKKRDNEMGFVVDLQARMEIVTQT